MVFKLQKKLITTTSIILLLLITLTILSGCTITTTCHKGAPGAVCQAGEDDPLSTNYCPADCRASSYSQTDIIQEKEDALESIIAEFKLTSEDLQLFKENGINVTGKTVTIDSENTGPKDSKWNPIQYLLQKNVERQSVSGSAPSASGTGSGIPEVCAFTDNGEYSDEKGINLKIKGEAYDSMIRIGERCYQDGGTELIESYCLNGPKKDPFAHCPEKISCYNGACNSPSICVATNELNPLIRGSIIGKEKGDGPIVTKENSCFGNTTVWAYYCDGDLIRAEEIDCLGKYDICIKGVCVDTDFDPRSP